jgi:hypothetical protein
MLSDHYEVFSSALLHAPMEREKLWLFPNQNELESGVKLPKHLVLYSPEDKSLLSNVLNFEGTKITLGCSPRFERWKKIKETEKPLGKRILFVSSIAQWDNHIVISALKSLVSH